MIRSLFAALALIAALGSTAVAEKPARFLAKVEMEFRRGDSSFEVKTQIGGPLDRPEKTSLGEIKSVIARKDQPVEMKSVKVEVTFEPMLIEKTRFVMASFRVTEKRDDEKERILAEPTIITAMGRPASFFTGDPKGDHVKVEFTPEVSK